jgi:hypothetical protein
MAPFCCSGVLEACPGRLVPRGGRGGGGGAGGSWGQGGAAAVSAVRVWRRRLRVFGGRPLAARRVFSSCRAFQAARMRWLRTVSSVTVNSMRGARPVRRHQPRAVSLPAGSLAVAKLRSAPVRRAQERRQAADG